MAQLPARDVADPPHILRGDRLVESLLRTPLGAELGRHITGIGDRRDRIARRQLKQEKRERGRNEHHEHALQGAADEPRADALRRSLARLIQRATPKPILSRSMRCAGSIDQSASDAYQPSARSEGMRMRLCTATGSRCSYSQTDGASSMAC